MKTRVCLKYFLHDCCMKPGKVYLGTTEGDFKQHFDNHKKSSNNSAYRNETTLSKYKFKEKYNETPVLKWYIVKTVPSNSNINKRCLPKNQKYYVTLTKTGHLN